jgi:hypothetical protein
MTDIPAADARAKLDANLLVVKIRPRTVEAIEAAIIENTGDGEFAAYVAEFLLHSNKRRAAVLDAVEAIAETARLNGVATVWEHLRRIAKEGLGIIWEPSQGVDVLVDKARELRGARRLVRGEGDSDDTD